MGRAGGRKNRGHAARQKAIALACDLWLLPKNRSTLPSILLLPRRPLRGEQAILALDLHQHAIGHQSLNDVWQLLTQFRG